MKKQFLLIFAVILTGCQDNVYNRIRSYIDTIEIVDTHEHLQTPRDSTDFYFFNTVSYFTSDIYSAGSPPFYDPDKKKFDVDSLWNKFGKYYNYSRATSYHEQFMNSLRILYGYDKPYVVKEDIKALYDKMISNNYRNYIEWFDVVFHKGNFKTMLLDQYWNQFNTQIDTAYFQLVCNINKLSVWLTKLLKTKK